MFINIDKMLIFILNIIFKSFILIKRKNKKMTKKKFYKIKINYKIKTYILT